jgi:hypothetical protein
MLRFLFLLDLPYFAGLLAEKNCSLNNFRKDFFQA